MAKFPLILSNCLNLEPFGNASLEAYNNISLLFKKWAAPIKIPRLPSPSLQGIDVEKIESCIYFTV